MSNKHLFQKFGFLRAPFGIGVGRYVCQLQRITIKFCKSHGDSFGIRSFLEHDLIDYAKQNPGVVVYVKPRRHRSPVLKAEYCKKDIIQWMELLKTQYHDGPALRLLKLWHTDFPSIQGPWTPFTFKNPSLNQIKFPDKKIGEALKFKPTATEELIRLFEEQQEAEKFDQEIPVQK
ncbi:unnamed protein product, partial [Heterotrigona itama]